MSNVFSPVSSVSVWIDGKEHSLPRVDKEKTLVPCKSCADVNAQRNKDVSTYLANAPSATALAYATSVTSPHLFFPKFGVFLTDVAVSSCLARWS